MGPAGETRMACPDPGAAETERRFLRQPGAVVKFGFMAGRLMLMEEGGAPGGHPFSHCQNAGKFVTFILPSGHPYY